MNKIAVVDSGISIDYFNKHQDLFIDYVYYKYVGDKIVKLKEIGDAYGHGTSCVDCIHQLLPSAKFYVVRILDEDGNTSVEMLTQALLDLIDTDIDIVNLSLSLTDNSCKNLEGVCQELSNKGKLIISSVENGEISSYPAAFDSVIGVIGDMMESDREYSYVKDNPVDIISDIAPMLVETASDEYDFFSGNSKATCIATVLIAEALENIIDDVKKSKLKNYIVDTLHKNTVSYKELPKMNGIPIINENRLYKPSKDIGIDYLEKQFIDLLDCTKEELYSKRLIELEGFFPNFLCEILENQSKYLKRRIKLNRFTYRNFEWFWCLAKYIEENLEVSTEGDRQFEV